MNRLSFIKSLIGAPLIPLAGISEEKEEAIQGNLENCIPQWPYKERLFDFQQQIWEDYNKFEKNLFIMSRGSSKSFMTSRIASLKFGPERGSRFKTHGVTVSTGEKEVFIDELRSHHRIYIFPKNEDKVFEKVTVFTSVHENEELLKEIISTSKWNVLCFNIDNLPKVLFDEKMIESVKRSMSDRCFRKQFLCDFS